MTLPGNEWNVALHDRPVTRLDEFLIRLRSRGKLDYKRYLGSPLRYAGGKSLAVGYLLERLPHNLERLVSPFFGGGSVEIALAKEIGVQVTGYDVFDILTNYWQIQLADPVGLHRSLAMFEPTRETFAEVKERLKAHWLEGETLPPLDLAAHYYFNSNTSYGPHFLGWPSDIYLQPVRYNKMIDKVHSFRAPTLQVECASFEDSIPDHPGDFLYCDPPYYLEDGMTFTGMYIDRTETFRCTTSILTMPVCVTCCYPGRAVFSCLTTIVPLGIREWYAGRCQMFSPKWQYTFGQGDTRIGINREQMNVHPSRFPRKAIPRTFDLAS